MKNRALGYFGVAMAAFGGIVILIDMLVPHTSEGTVSYHGFAAPTGWTILAIGAALFLLATDPEVLGALPVVGKYFVKKNDDANPPAPPAPGAPK